ncbi:MAG: ABC transporter ATP-binding protein, partial [Candidatus Muiribacteriaceae bacterium]
FAEEHTVILSTHILPEVSVTCDRVVIMNRGRIIAEDTPDRLLENFRHKVAHNISVLVSGDGSACRNAIEEFDCDLTFAQREGDTLFKVVNRTDRDIRNDIIKALTEKNIPVLEVYSHNPQLEEVFIDLVSEEEK